MCKKMCTSSAEWVVCKLGSLSRTTRRRQRCSPCRSYEHYLVCPVHSHVFKVHMDHCCPGRKSHIWNTGCRHDNTRIGSRVP